MTPFDSFFARTIQPTLPQDCPADVLKALKEPLAACWNAALDAGVEAQVQPGSASFRERWDRLRVTP